MFCTCIQTQHPDALQYPKPTVGDGRKRKTHKFIYYCCTFCCVRVNTRSCCCSQHYVLQILLLLYCCSSQEPTSRKNVFFFFTRCMRIPKRRALTHHHTPTCFRQASRAAITATKKISYTQATTRTTQTNPFGWHLPSLHFEKNKHTHTLVPC